MQYQHVCLEALGYTLPEEIVSSDEIERRLAPVYTRLRLPEGRLELMTGIQARRFWPRGTLPGEMSVLSGERAIQAGGIQREEIGLLVHGSVCRDYLEPATASGVHARLKLAETCQVYDVSNACLGLLNGITQAANMIELGQIRAALVLGTEGGRQLVETTIATLNDDRTLTRDSIKPAFASLTIGSGSCAVLLVHRELSRTDNRLLSATWRANTRFHHLCQSKQEDTAGDGMRPLMDTDSEQLLHAGIATGQATFETFLGELGWTASRIDRSICHQVGSAHRKAMLSALGLRPERDFTSFEFLGNTGAVALPITLALALKDRAVQAGENVALLGIGSGINSLMLAAQWQKTFVAGGLPGE